MIRQSFLGFACAVSFAAVAHADTINVVTDATFPPFEYVESGNLTGFDIELMNAIAAQMGDEVNWINGDFKGLVPSLVARRADIAISAIYITDERLEVVDFSEPYYTGGLVIMTKTEGSDITGPDTMDGKSIAVQVGTKSTSFLRENFPDVNIVEVEKNDQMFSLVQTGRADGAVTGKPAALLYVKSNPDVQVLEEQLTSENYGIAVRKDKPELVTAVNEAIETLKADGTYQTLLEKYFGQ
ncbi:transporter substrate-binding domain-containing protein [Paracoccus sp. SM22M-07]|uniref:transporter substrate-binding domain-containing protein n=1 Tax=Paracoccus sp. SM22M-07 TaxID=1520813 RepID=UPI0009185334|nr:transporter substrate-binding domain-containing protein [Paracoccus sp. SM22M-07]OJH43077.1 ABC transporter permease [Paracoccus sp. SM22M-07]